MCMGPEERPRVQDLHVGGLWEECVTFRAVPIGRLGAHLAAVGWSS